MSRLTVVIKEPEIRTRRTAAETREHVLAVAAELFYWHGIRALVAAYIERADRLYREWFTSAADAGGGDPRERILAVFEALGEQVQPQHCRGCPFLMALAEFPDPHLAAHSNAVTPKRWVRDRLGELTDELATTTPIRDAGALADDLAVVLEGVYASAQALGANGPAKRARALAEALIAAAPGL